MGFIHSRDFLNGGSVVVVSCDHQCNVLLMDDSNFQRYRTGGQFRYYGGFRKTFPTRISVPNSGNWNVVLDLAGGSARIRYSIQYLPQAA